MYRIPIYPNNGSSKTCVITVGQRMIQHRPLPHWQIGNDGIIQLLEETKYFKHCTPMFYNIGTECEKIVVHIKGVDFESLLQRITVIERYIANRELERLNTCLRSSVNP